MWEHFHCSHAEPSTLSSLDSKSLLDPRHDGVNRKAITDPTHDPNAVGVDPLDSIGTVTRDDSEDLGEDGEHFSFLSFCPGLSRARLHSTSCVVLAASAARDLSPEGDMTVYFWRRPEEGSSKR